MVALAAAVALGVASPTAALSQGGAAPSQPKPAGPKPGKSKAAKPKPAKPKPADPTGPPKLDARAWVLIDPRDDEVLAGKAPDTPRPIASATKLMTAWVALKKLKPKQVITAPPYNASAAESLLGIRPGERLTVRDLLYGLILRSGNDAAVALATGSAGSVPAFVKQMNSQADALGLSNTSYANPVGLDAPQNYSSAADLAELASRLLEIPLFARVAGSATATTRSGNATRRLTTRNTLLNADPTADGIKTGRTIGAGYVLVGSATRNWTQLISAVLGARSEAARDAETEKLLDYGFSLYKPSTPVEAGEELADPKLDYRDKRLALVAEKPIKVSAREGQPVETTIDAPGEVSGAIEEGEALGSVSVTVDGRNAVSVKLVAADSVGAATTTDKVISVVANPFILIPAGLIVIVVGMVLASAGRRHNRSKPAPPSGGNGNAPGSSPAPGPPEKPATPKRRRRTGTAAERTQEERRKMQEERMRRRQQRAGGGGSP
ncbi:hypothetical protein BH20ACT15_BH20ACT15_06280 [soil metagenome]